MDRGLDWYKRDPIEFLDGVQGMGPELIGAYAVIIDLLYARAGRTPRDDRHLSGVMGCSIRKASALTEKLIQNGKITFHDGFITSSRASRQSKSRRELSETRAEQGRKGGEKSAQSRKNNYLGEAIAPSKTEAEERRVEESRESRPSVSCAKPKKSIIGGSDKKAKPKPIRFEEFWDTAFPHRGGAKKGRAKAEKKYTDAFLDGTPESEIIKGAMRYGQDRQVTDGYAKDPATWLNQEGWKDEIEQSNNNGQQSGYSRGPQGRQNGASGAHAGLIAGLAENADRYSRGEGSDGNDDQIPM